MTRSQITLIACLLVLPSPATAQKPTKAGLAAGKIFVQAFKVKGSEAPSMKLTAVIEAPPGKIWPLVSNCNQFSRTMPRIAKGRIVSSKGKHVICRVTVDLPFPLSNITSTTDGIHIIRKGQYYSRRWTLISGDYKENRGSWVLTRFEGNPRRTLVVYSVYVVPKTSIPNWLRTMAQKKSLPEMIKRMRKIAKNMGW